jgi:hypothetical protein
VVSVLDHAVDVLLVELGLVRRAYMDRLDIRSFTVRRLNSINYLDLGKSSTRNRIVNSSIELDLIKWLMVASPIDRVVYATLIMCS